MLPLWRAPSGPGTRWQSGRWFIRPERLYLTPGDSPMGFRLPLDSLPWVIPGDDPRIDELDPFAPRDALPSREALSVRGRAGLSEEFATSQRAGSRGDVAFGGSRGPETRAKGPAEPRFHPQGESAARPQRFKSDTGTVRTAICVEPRDGVLHIFMPPLAEVVDYLELCAVIEDTADELGKKIRLEGYHPPSDPRMNRLSVTPDPGVIEVNVHPARAGTSWCRTPRSSTKRRARPTCDREIHARRAPYRHRRRKPRRARRGHARRQPHAAPPRSLAQPGRLLAEPSVAVVLVLGHVRGADQSVAARRRSASRQRLRARYRVPPARTQLGRQLPPPWLVDRIFRNLLIDVTGNTHRTEFCIDKLYSPDSTSGRSGLVELRAFEMPPHARMSLTQQLLVRALVAEFWRRRTERPVRWGTELHDRFSLPHFVRAGFRRRPRRSAARRVPVRRRHGSRRTTSFAFRCCGTSKRAAGSSWSCGRPSSRGTCSAKKPAGGGTARYVDSSVERLEVKVRGMTDERHVIACNGRRVPLHPTGTNGEFVAGVRYRAWHPPSASAPHDRCSLTSRVRRRRPLERARGRGCTYHVAHPGGSAPSLSDATASRPRAAAVRGSTALVIRRGLASCRRSNRIRSFR